MNNFDYKNMTPFKWFVLENFPFIENDFEAINNYRLFSKVVEYLNKTIDNVNVLGNLIEQFSDYFDNLDLQEEVNNKLDEMAEDGTLEEIIADYLNSKAIFGFTNVNEMKQASNLLVGSYAQTLGYYNINDGGGSLYKIREKTIDDTANNMDLILLNSGLVAEYCTKGNYINVDDFGAKGNGTDNDSSIIQHVIDYAKNNRNLTIKFSAKTYLIDNINITKNNTHLEGIRTNDAVEQGTILKGIASVNPLIFIGNSTYGSAMLIGGSLKNISLMGAGNRQDYKYAINKTGIKILNAAEFTIENVFVSQFLNSGVYAQDWWDSNVIGLEIRGCGTPDEYASLYLGSENDNCNSLHFFGLHIEETPYHLHIDGLASNNQFVASKFEGGTASASVVNQFIKIYEGVYATTFDSCFFSLGKKDNIKWIHAKNNLTSIVNCSFAMAGTDKGILIENSSLNANFGRGIKILGNTFQSFGGDATIVLNQGALFTNNVINYKTSIAKIICNSGDNNISNNIFKCNSLSGDIIKFVRNQNIAKDNRIIDGTNAHLYSSDSARNNNVPIYGQSFFNFDTAKQVWDLSKYSTANLLVTSAMTITSANFTNALDGQEIYIYCNANVSIDSSVLIQGTTSVNAGHMVMLKYIGIFSKWCLIN